MATRIDIKHLRARWLPLLNDELSKPRHGTKRYQVHRISICAVVLSQDEAEIGHLMETKPFFGVMQEKLDWQSDDDLDDQNEGDGYQHLLRMSNSEDRRLRRTHDCYLLGNVTSAGPVLDGGSEPCSSRSSKSLRWSRLEILNVPDHENRGYFIGESADEEFAALADSAGSMGPTYLQLMWSYFFVGRTPKLVWVQERLKTAVLLQWQVDLVKLSSLAIPLSRRHPRKRYGPFLQVHGEESLPESRENGAPEAKRIKCVRLHSGRKKWVAEMRLPNKVRKNKVTFGDFKCQDQAAHGVDAVYYYGKQEQVRFVDTPQVLPGLPTGLEEEEKLEFVRRQAKWLAHLAPMLLASVNAQEIPGGHTAVTDLLCPSPTPATPLVLNTLISSTSNVGGSVEMPPEMFLEQSLSNNLEFTAEQVESYMQTMLQDDLSYDMGSGVHDLVDGGSTAPDWFHMDSTLPGFDDNGDMDTRLLGSQSLQDPTLFQGW